MDLEEYRRRFGGRDDSAPGWEAIDVRLQELYPEQDPRHWGTLISHRLGGPDPLDGISAYESQAGGGGHLHFITYGYSALYFDEEAAGGEFSQFGFEMTFRLASDLPPAEEPVWVCNLLQNLARYVFESGRWFEQYHWIPANGPIYADSDTALVGLVFVNDPELAPLDSPHGRVEFLQAFGITQTELDSLVSKKQTAEAIIDRHRRKNPLLVTDLARHDL
jgi:Suppressor of fused protein (SUFU)